MPYIFYDYDIKVASSIDERCAAWALVYEAYVSKGYADPNPQELWYGIYDVLPDTTTFLATRRPLLSAEEWQNVSHGLGGQAIAALSMVFDSKLGFPADELYNPELDHLRSSGRRLCEITSLANLETRPRIGVNLTKHLFKLAYITAFFLQNATDFIITVNPRHVAFYEKYLLFERMGQERSYDKVNGAPAVLLRLDLLNATKEVSQKHTEGLSGKFDQYQEFMLEGAEEIQDWLGLQRHPLDWADIQEYFIEERPLLQTLKPEQRSYLEEQYMAWHKAA